MAKTFINDNSERNPVRSSEQLRGIAEENL